jgi:hypothetical protein
MGGRALSICGAPWLLRAFLGARPMGWIGLAAVCLSGKVALPSSLEAVKATRCAGGFAGLDSFARRRPFATMFLW